jgi:hypothetical protein
LSPENLRLTAAFADGKLKKISVQGGAPVVLCAAVNPRGASWGEDGNIVGRLIYRAPTRECPPRVERGNPSLNSAAGSISPLAAGPA